MKRRTFLKNTFLSVTGVSILGGLYAWQIEPFCLEFVKIKMPIRNLPNHLVGKTLMQISDIHVGKRFDYHYLIDSFKKAKEYQADFVAYTGDYISKYKEKIYYKEFEEVLQHAVNGKIATVGVLGNHDYGTKWKEPNVAEKVVAMIEANGIKILRNEQAEFGGLNFIGFDDYWAINFNPELSMKDFNSNKANIALCHNPDVCDLDVWNGYNSWILSGHTHGGQVKPPFLPPLIVPVKNKTYTAGKFDLSDGRTLYINRALGHLRQIRFNVRPEITIFELERV